MNNQGIIPWQGVPNVVRWPCVFWFSVCVLGIVELGISIILYIRSPVVGMTHLLLAGGFLQLCLIGLLFFVIYKLMLGARWARIVLEVVTWIGLAGVLFDFVILTASALFNWEEFKTDIGKQFPTLSPALKILVMYVLLAVMASIVLLILRALRSERAIRYVSASPAQMN